MRKLLVMAALVFVGTMGWRIGGRLSVDALGMAVGIVFGVLASIPAALLVLAASQGSRAGRSQEGEGQAGRSGPGAPPVIVVTGPAQVVGQANIHRDQGQPAQTPPPIIVEDRGEVQGRARRFLVLGEDDDWADEW